MANPEMKKYQDATTADKLGKSVQQARELHAQFFALFDQFRQALLNLDIASEPVPQGDGTTRLRVITPFGNLYASAAYAFDDGHAGAAMLFTDEKKVDDRTVSRKLNAVILGREGFWIDSDGDRLKTPFTQISEQIVYASVHKALAAKLKADSEYVSSFTRAFLV
ncbi:MULTISPECIES: hypothetical protein [unclassified Polaromonas]|uniref:hypothetical protein n=1 Tax=unclassified Polaromonas TaxID=2638319 RepID=UPI0018CAB5EF|nr:MULTISPECIES: hypothetical protein [unclassified Polaromonas]MBG6071031.1 hypothetical protein [Polaromonas sp. CG_9.7]MBG6112659.1 hypothetical protein [Polaromonas sp. CG_9.2]MDH6186134.1 hypothetical protein [Polaromonas sp. CG_23.6]